MSLYNIVKGVNPATFFVMCVLGKHTDEYPRFRDCFVRKGNIVILTRTGGGNREGYVTENQEIRGGKGFLADYDDGFDSTFAYWEFSVPLKWQKDIACLLKGEVSRVSQEYRELFYEVYPKLKDKVDNEFWSKDLPSEWGERMIFKDEQTPFDDWPGMP